VKFPGNVEEIIWKFPETNLGCVAGNIWNIPVGRVNAQRCCQLGMDIWIIQSSVGQKMLEKLNVSDVFGFI